MKPGATVTLAILLGLGTGSCAGFTGQSEVFLLQAGPVPREFALDQVNLMPGYLYAEGKPQLLALIITVARKHGVVLDRADSSFALSLDIAEQHFFRGIDKLYSFMVSGEIFHLHTDRVRARLLFTGESENSIENRAHAQAIFEEVFGSLSLALENTQKEKGYEDR